MHKTPPTSGQDSLSNILKAVVCIVSHSWFRKPAKSINISFVSTFKKQYKQKVQHHLNTGLQNKNNLSCQALSDIKTSEVRNTNCLIVSRVITNIPLV